MEDEVVDLVVRRRRMLSSYSRDSPSEGSSRKGPNSSPWAIAELADPAIARKISPAHAAGARSIRMFPLLNHEA